MTAPLLVVVSTIVTSVLYGDGVLGIVQPVPDHTIDPIVLPVEVRDILVPRTHAMISRVPTL